MTIEQAIAAAVKDAVVEAVREALAAPRLVVPASYRISTAAEVLDCHEDTLRAQVDRGEVPVIDVGGRGGRRIPGWWVHGLSAPSTQLRLVSTTEEVR